MLSKYAAMIGRLTLEKWMNHVQPQHEESAAYWLGRFNIMGPFHASVEVWHNPVDHLVLHVVGTVTDLQALDVAPPTTLYRAASERGKDGWSWTTDYAYAQMIANARGPNVEVFKANAGRVFGRLDVDRYFTQTNSPVVEHDRRTVWLMEPFGVELLNRWVEGDALGVSAPEWLARGTTEEEVTALVKAWLNVNPNNQSAADNFGKEFWREKFAGVGQFTSTANSASVVKVAPISGLKPPSRLFRAATPEYANSLSWTTEEHAVRMYESWRGPDAQVWTAEAGRVFGRVRWQGSERVAPYWEWLIDPVNVRPWSLPGR
jgi:hypothetical protein